MAPGPRLRRSRARGVTLLEMLLVIALIAVAGVLAAGVLGGGIDGLRLRSNGKQLASELRLVRTRAMASGVPQQFEIDPRSGRWSSTLGHHGQVPAQLRMAFTGAREVQPRQGTGAIRFFADGASTGGRIELAARQARWRIDVAWITGEVRSGRLEASP
ncbi:type II secretion system protein GspH [Stenotrophomonas panacihumi]|uniref:Type II secretion system protein H n=1 Tax=Stenotrophomonas panacihumi TaxID=676599 RepID=A0A0R0AK93_9GAMM|nr:GspH/FimT family pseudopilin [Stenotrophomonas panacihumi]KRG45551.1 type II secretion system protein GspH [Stenotrophomonas panacihumi]PTN55312.1 prepilin-type N-terminal cleavage/methylation domain-containing protein [Stenotrophomonas panacihumi]